MSDALQADAVQIRRARLEDVEFLVELANHPEVEPFLGAVSARDRRAVLEEIEHSRAEPEALGRFVIEVLDDREWRRAGSLGFHVSSRYSRIARCEQLAVHPDFRGRGIADTAARLLQRHLLFDLDYHRLELEC